MLFYPWADEQFKVILCKTFSCVLHNIFLKFFEAVYNISGQNFMYLVICQWVYDYLFMTDPEL